MSIPSNLTSRNNSAARSGVGTTPDCQPHNASNATTRTVRPRARTSRTSSINHRDVRPKFLAVLLRVLEDAALPHEPRGRALTAARRNSEAEPRPGWLGAWRQLPRDCRKGGATSVHWGEGGNQGKATTIVILSLRHGHVLIFIQACVVGFGVTLALV